MIWTYILELAGINWSRPWVLLRRAVLIGLLLLAPGLVTRVALAYGQQRAHVIEQQLQHELRQIQRTVPACVSPKACSHGTP